MMPVFSPLSTLPAEMLLEVFEQAVLEVRDSGPELMRSLNTITSVTSFWRDLAIHYSPLWANIHVKWPVPKISMGELNKPTQILDSDLDRVRSFLKRSKRSPLRLYVARSWFRWQRLSEDERLQMDRTSQWSLMHDLLAPHLERCYSISIFSPGIAMAGPPLQFLRTSEFPRLQEVSFIGVDSNLPQDSESEPWKLGVEHTSLRALKFSDSKRYLPMALDVSWPSLSSLELNVDAQFWLKVCDTLAKLPNLRVLSLRLGKNTPLHLTNPVRQERVTLPTLEKLSTNTPAVWLGISTPCLSSATLTSFGSGTIIGTSYFPELIKMLEELSLQELIFLDSSLLPALTSPILRAFSSVESLQILDSRGNEGVLEPLAHELEMRGYINKSSQAGMLPKLKSLAIQTSSASYSLPGSSFILHNYVDRLRSASIDVTWRHYEGSL